VSWQSNSSIDQTFLKYAHNVSGYANTIASELPGLPNGGLIMLIVALSAAFLFGIVVGSGLEILVRSDR
jgi:hypothetical protein